MPFSVLPRCKRISTYPGKVQTVFIELTNSFHKQAVCLQAWMASPMPHSQANSIWLKAGNTIPAGAFWYLGGFSARGLTAHFCILPVLHHSQCSRSAGYKHLHLAAGPAFHGGSLMMSLLPAPLLPALWHCSVPLQCLLSQSTETLTLSAAVHSSNKDIIIN